MTGLRRGELSKVEKRDSNLDQARMVIRAEVSKAKKNAVLPLHEEMVPLLRKKTMLLNPTDLVFNPVPNILTYQRDLERAGIPYVDENGRYLDFHSLRATFATRLLRNGVLPSKAIRLTRHASVKTLEKHYDGLGLSDAEQAIRQLPGLGNADGDED
jgi:integrase